MWILQGDSYGLTEELRKHAAESTIELRPDGHFVATRFPMREMEGPGISDGLISGTGDWKLESWDGSQMVRLSFHTASDAPRGKVSIGTRLAMDGVWSVNTLYEFVGDPDLLQKVKFQRREE